MSKAFHKNYRKVLSVRTYNIVCGELTLRARDVMWCTLENETSRTIKTSHIGFTTLIGHSNGVEARFYKKQISINKKNPLNSKGLPDKEMCERLFEKSRSDAAKYYLIRTQTELKGMVSWFDKSNGQGYIRIEKLDLLLPVYACNIAGKKTWYPETACVYLKDNEEVTVKLTDLGHLSVVVIGGNIHFDSKKWNSLDQSRLAFKCDENGNAINGLFSE